VGTQYRTSGLTEIAKDSFAQSIGPGGPPRHPILVGDIVEQVSCNRVWVTGETLLDDAAVPDRMQIPAAQAA
jgi:hypothetical protein